MKIEDLENIKDNSMFVENFAKGFRKELKAAKEEGKIEGEKDRQYISGWFYGSGKVYHIQTATAVVGLEGSRYRQIHCWKKKNEYSGYF